MNITPTLEQVKSIAATKEYNVIPVSCELLSDFITPIEAMRKLKNVSTHCYMLESAQADETWGRYTFMGYDPKMEITCKDNELVAGDLKVTTDKPDAYLRDILSKYKSPRFDYLPSFTGGLVGYFSYDYFGYCEPTAKCNVEDTDAFKDLDLMLFDKVIAFDNVRQKIILIINIKTEGNIEENYNSAKEELGKIKDLLYKGEKSTEKPGKLLGEVTPLFTKEK